MSEIIKKELDNLNNDMLNVYRGGVSVTQTNNKKRVVKKWEKLFKDIFKKRRKYH